MRFARWALVTAFSSAACSSAAWTDTFAGSDTRSTSVTAADAAPPPPDAGPVQSCDGLAQSSPTVPITVTFPGHGSSAETIHIATAAGSCDLTVDSDTDGVIFASDAVPCAKLVAAGTPESGTAQVSGTSSPNDLLFQWSYGLACTILDDYKLDKK